MQRYFNTVADTLNVIGFNHTAIKF